MMHRKCASKRTVVDFLFLLIVDAPMLLAVVPGDEKLTALKLYMIRAVGSFFNVFYIAAYGFIMIRKLKPPVMGSIVVGEYCTISYLLVLSQ